MFSLPRLLGIENVQNLCMKTPVRGELVQFVPIRLMAPSHNFSIMSLRQESSLIAPRTLQQLEGVYSSLGILPGHKVPNLPEQSVGLCKTGSSNAS